MYLTLSPFFYYIANQPSIDTFIALESNGARAYHIPKSKLENIIDRYIALNSHGVDESKREKYIEYICESILQT